MATRDPLTGAFNRRYFNDHFDRLIKHAEENRQPISLILADIDRFKTVNDTYGHPAGDAVLQEFMRRIGIQTRATDMVARFGGEEFAIVTPDANLEVAGRVAERLRACIADNKFELADGTSIAMSCSFGVAAVGESDTLADVLARSDAALYEAKSGGRNRVIVAASAEIEADVQSA
jgi:two-component system cell cycle response regulator